LAVRGCRIPQIVAYAEVAERLNEHGVEETEESIGAKLARGTF
jgi:hypothetical protein